MAAEFLADPDGRPGSDARAVFVGTQRLALRKHLESRLPRDLREEAPAVA